MKSDRKRIDWLLTLFPFLAILLLGVLFFVFPESSNNALGRIRFFFGDTFGIYYLIIGLGMFLLSLYFAFSKYGDIILGNKNEKPQYSFFVWGSMMFTCGLAADILFYSFSEWIMYASNPHIAELGDFQDWAGVFPLYHWSFIPWSFYLVLAVSFGFMLHVRKCNRQRFSEACRPLLGNRTYGIAGRIIDLFSLFALLAGTATTFSIATPLMSSILIRVFHIEISRTAITVIILLITCIIYTFACLYGFKGIGLLAKTCIYLFFALLVIVFCVGGQGKYIVETGFESFGRMLQNFIGLSTYTDPLRKTNFPQDWTVYYWAYWMVWCVAAPFFIGNISRGRSVRQVILGGYLFGVGSTIISFVILGNYSMGLQVTNQYDFIALFQSTDDIYTVILSIIDTLPGSVWIMLLVLVTMITFYATSFDSIAYTASCYSYKTLEDGEHPHKLVQLLWCVLLIVLPISLVFSESSMANLQSVSIISAFPIGIIMILIVISFMKDSKKDISGNKPL